MLWILTSKLAFAVDTAEAFIVRAASPRTARKLAAEQAGDEEADVWLHSYRSTCKQLKLEGDVEVILRSFNAG